jgi:pilus assembly protein CpaF
MTTTAFQSTQFETFFAYLPELRPLFADDEITEIMIVPQGDEKYSVDIERNGLLEEVLEDNHLDTVLLLAAARDIAATVLNRDIDEAEPMLSATLDDGSRITIVIPPRSDLGVSVCIRKHRANIRTVEELIAFGTLPLEITSTISDAIERHKNFLISGPPGTGKTTILNALASAYIPHDRRIIVVEDEVREIKLPYHKRKHFLTAGGNTTISDLIRISLRMKPHHLIVGEVLGSEAFQLLKAFNLGLSGSFCTLHADSATEALDRLTVAVVEAGTSMTYESIRMRIAQSIHYVIHMEQALDGKRIVSDFVRIADLDRHSNKFQFEVLYQSGPR